MNDALGLPLVGAQGPVKPALDAELESRESTATYRSLPPKRAARTERRGRARRRRLRGARIATDSTGSSWVARAGAPAPQPIELDDEDALPLPELRMKRSRASGHHATPRHPCRRHRCRRTRRPCHPPTHHRRHRRRLPHHHRRLLRSARFHSNRQPQRRARRGEFPDVHVRALDRAVQRQGDVGSEMVWARHWTASA